MKPKIDVWRTASALLAEHGSSAVFVAALQADALLAQYDVEGHLAWKRVRMALRELQRAKPAAGEWLN
jgi:hypothetical protein